MTWLTEPLHYAFFVRGLLVGMLLGITCGALGCFVVLRGMAFIGDAMAHSVLPGVVIAYLLGVNIIAGAFVTGLLAALLISAINSSVIHQRPDYQRRQRTDRRWRKCSQFQLHAER